MKTKDKVILGIVILILLILIFSYYNIYTNQAVSYATDVQEQQEDVVISNAQKVDVESLIENKQKQNVEQIITEELELEYTTVYKNNKDLPKGTMQVVQEGRTGLQQVTKKRTIDENQQIHEEEISSETFT